MGAVTPPVAKIESVTCANFIRNGQVDVHTFWREQDLDQLIRARWRLL